MKTAAEFHAALRANVDALCSHAMTHPEFNSAQQKAWDEIRAAGDAIEGEVLALIRAELPGAR